MPQELPQGLGRRARGLEDRPRHDTASHGADAFRALAMTYRDIPVEAKETGPYDPQGRPIRTHTREWNLFI
jgi:hypothetical protein